MAHELMIENTEASIMYVGQVPWHGLGKQLDNPATSAEAIKAANLDWQVVKKPLYAIEGDTRVKTDKFAVVRQDKWGQKECKVLGIVGDAYTHVQNSDAFQFFDKIVGAGEAIYHTAGALGNGERIWILAKLPSDIEVKGDMVNKFLLLANGHDGSLSVQIKFTPIRVVCQNTLTQALTTDATGLRIPHGRSVHARLSKAPEALGIIRKTFDDLQKMFDMMASKELDTDLLNKYHQEVFPLPKEIKTKEDAAKDKMMRGMRDAATYFFENGAGNNQPKIKRTLWTAYNGITEFIDHHRQLNSRVDKLKYIWFGSGNAVKVKAYDQALLLLK
jgi:phage/plasmid-like protein (TIGR03299 family)